MKSQYSKAYLRLPLKRLADPTALPRIEAETGQHPTLHTSRRSSLPVSHYGLEFGV